MLWRALVCGALAAALGGCAQTSPPAAGVPSEAVSPPQTHVDDGTPPLSAAVMPDEISSALLNGYTAEAARFLARTLETAPDGAKRRWRSIDKGTTLIVQPRATHVTAQVICRDVEVRVVTARGSRDFEMRACRLQNGLWTN